MIKSPKRKASYDRGTVNQHLHLEEGKGIEYLHPTGMEDNIWKNMIVSVLYAVEAIYTNFTKH